MSGTRTVGVMGTSADKTKEYQRERSESLDKLYEIINAKRWYFDLRQYGLRVQSIRLGYMPGQQDEKICIIFNFVLDDDWFEEDPYNRVLTSEELGRLVAARFDQKDGYQIERDMSVIHPHCVIHVEPDKLALTIHRISNPSLGTYSYKDLAIRSVIGGTMVGLLAKRPVEKPLEFIGVTIGVSLVSFIGSWLCNYICHQNR